MFFVRSKTLRILGLLAMISVFSNPSISAENSPSSQASQLAQTVHIAVASNFTHTMKHLIDEFEQQSLHRIKASYGSSGKIYAQIQHGAPFVLFFSADQSKPLALYEQGLTQTKPFTYALGSLALWSNSKQVLQLLNIKTLKNTTPENKALKNEKDVLTSGQFNKLALANPKLAPYGTAAMEVLEKLILKAATQSKWVMGENIAQTYQFVSTGNAELGFVALSQVIGKHSSALKPPLSYWPVPEKLHQPIRQDAVYLTTPASQQQNSHQAATEFLKFMNTKKAQTIIQSYGYRTEKL